MPNMDGLEATEKIRDIELMTSSNSLESVPIVALSAGAMKGDRETRTASGHERILVQASHLRSTRDNARKISSCRSQREKGNSDFVQRLIAGIIQSRSLTALHESPRLNVLRLEQVRFFPHMHSQDQLARVISATTTKH
jgi:CheY-like chemotaxis protein